MNKIEKCMRTDPDIIMISKDLKKTSVQPGNQILTTMMDQNISHIVKNMKKKELIFEKINYKLKNDL